MIKRPVSIKKARVPAMWLVLHVGHFAPEYGREIAVFWDEAAANACSDERNKFNYATTVTVYAYDDECE
jgi:hypothetical protein